MIHLFLTFPDKLQSSLHSKGKPDVKTRLLCEFGPEFIAKCTVSENS